MSSLAEFNRVARHVYGEPKFVAQVEYMRDYPSPMQQILGMVGRPAAVQFVNGGGWPDEVADMEVSVEIHDPPNFDWWEPRHDHPWRRQAARDRGDSA